MIDLSKYNVLEKNKTTLKQASLDDSENKKRYMTESLCSVIDFDKVKSQYSKGLHMTEEPCSVDAILSCKGKGIILIEFKNGCINELNIHKKVYDSTIIFCDITSKCVTDLRKEAIFILVYGREKNKKCQPVLEQQVPALESLADGIAKNAGREIIRFGLSRYKNYCFKEVHTYTIVEFDKFLKANGIV